MMPGFSAAVGLGLLAATGLLVIIARRRLAIVAVFGSSMQPTLAAGDRVLVRRVTIGSVRPGQIVVFEMPSPDGTWATDPPRGPSRYREWMIKRVTAVPGDCVPGIVGRPARSATLASIDPGGMVPEGRIIVLGDNLANSHDSRSLGYIPAERLLGIMVRPLR